MQPETPRRDVEPPAGSPPADANRRLYHRYPTGLPAEIVVGHRAVPCAIRDISLGGACVQVRAGDPALADSAEGTIALRADAIGGGLHLPATARRLGDDRLHLAFHLEDHHDFELTMFLLGSAATMGGISGDG